MSATEDGSGDPAHDNIQQTDLSSLTVEEMPAVSNHEGERQDHADDGYQQQGRGYAQVSTRSDEDHDIERETLGTSESDPLYPPAPPGYYRRQYPMRITYFPRLIGVLLAIGVACFSIAAVIDVSTPSDRFEPGTDKQAVADGVLAAMDRSADPCDNFYEYACGSWMRSSKIPPDRTSYTKSFSAVFDMIQLMLKEILEVDLQDPKLPEPSKPGMFYASCMDQMGVGGLNTLALQRFRDDFNGLHNSDAFAKLIARMHAGSATALWDTDVGVDEKNPSRYALYLGQGGLGLPHRDNYMSMKDEDVETRKQYLNLIETLLITAGKARLIPRQGHDLVARQILELETMIANATKPPEDLRDPDEAYNKVSIEKLKEMVMMGEYFTELGVDLSKTNGTAVVDNPVFFATVGIMMQNLDRDVASRRTMRAYLAFHLVRQAASAGLLGESMYHENFKFKQHLYGLKQLPEQWKQCQSLANDMIGEAVGAAFVKKHFPESRKQVAVRLFKQIAKQFDDALGNLDWMDDQTKNLAKEKLAAINQKVGYSSKLDDYADVEISRSSYLNNFMALEAHATKKSLDHLGKPVDKTEWFMDPQEVNAYYSPTKNEIVFPAGILQQPFFSDAFPDAMNYGGIGAIVGHEMSHGFDDQGRKYDKNGLLTDWWTPSDAEKYQEKAQCYVDLFDTYKPRDTSIHVNGNLTLGENLADTNGVSVAYHAFKSIGNNSMEGLPPPNPLLARELTNDQLFFVSYAQVWCKLYRPQALKLQIMTDPHSPSQFRVLGPLSQNEDFAKVFKCRESSRYNPTNRCSLWN